MHHVVTVRLRNSLAIAICASKEEAMEPANASVFRGEHIVPNPKAKLFDYEGGSWGESRNS